MAGALDRFELESAHEALAFAEELADAARPIALRAFRRPPDVAAKGPTGLVTAVSRNIEAALCALIAARQSGHVVYDGDRYAGTKRSTWFLDPIDSTQAYLMGLPLFGTLIALVEDERPILGVIDMPVLRERWTGVAGGTHCNGRPVWTSSQRSLENARLYASSPEAISAEGRTVFERLGARATQCRFGGECYAYGLLASGYCDLVIGEGLQPNEFMSVVCIVEGAGGVVSDWTGYPLDLRSTGRVIAASTRQLHEEAIALIAVPTS